MPVDSFSMVWRRRSGMRLSARAAADEALPPRERHFQCFVGGGVGDTVAVELVEAVAAAGGPVFLAAFAGC